MTDADPAPYQALARPAGKRHIDVLDQRVLPHAVERVTVADADAATRAIREMWVRGAPLIGAVGAYGLAMALDRDASDAALARAHAMLDAARPTAVNLRWALDRVRDAVLALPRSERADAAWREAEAIAVEDAAINRAIGLHGLALLQAIAQRKSGPVQVMTHCNAGALATCGFGTATAPVFLAHAAGLPVHVWVSETRPRLQGANLTAWEMAQRGIPYTLFADSAGGALMRRGDVDLVLVGADRVTRNGDVCNKIGTYAKALAARDCAVPFYVALPSPTIDWTMASGDAIPIESRDASELLTVAGRGADGRSQTVAIAPADARAVNVAFDVTPARLVTGLLTERGVAAASAEALAAMFPERAPGGGATFNEGETGESALRESIVATALAMNAAGINRGKSGNVSARLRTEHGDAFLITPSGLPYDRTTPVDLVAMTLDGAARGARRPSSEWRFHRDIYRARPEAGAIVHTHAPFATALACLDRGIPPFHYMVAVAGGRDIRCAPYATFGTQALSDHAVAALAGRKACLLAHHGMIAVGATLDAALALAAEVETLAEMYWRALQAGEPTLLPDGEMDLVLEKFASYGQP